MQKKYHTFSKFLEFKALVEKESGKQVKALRSDNGGEYISNKFKKFCNKEGIRRELITLRLPHNLEKNGVTERNNREWSIHVCVNSLKEPRSSILLLMKGGIYIVSHSKTLACV